MSLPRYPNYKDSGVEWLGKVPGHWEVKKAKHLTSRISSGKTPLGGSEVYLDEGITFLRSQNVYDEGLRLDEVVFIAPAVDEAMAVSRVSNHDILLNITGASIGRSCVVPSGFPSANVNQHVCVIRLSDLTQVPYIAWVFKAASIKNQIDYAQNGAAREGLNFNQIGSMSFAFPPTDEQTQIAAFLDRETAKIDELVTEQRQLMELLKEKRQAVISHAVTRGLNPKAPMKPSGIEWLGDVPAHWITPTLNSRCSIELGKMLDEVRITGQHLVSYLRNVDVQWDSINFENLPVMDIQEAEYPRYTVQQGDLLICEGGEVGRAAMVGELTGVWGFQKALHRLRPRDGSENTRFLFYTFVWAAATGVFKAGGTSTIAHLTGEQLRRYRFPKPPHAEQVAIAAFLDTYTNQIDTLITEAQRAITLLQERRTAMISAAVTGQIDVRGAVAA